MIITLCELDELPDESSRGFAIEQDGHVHEILAVRHEGNVYAYRNRCPHTGVSLEWMPDQFLNYEKTHIQCATHGALFRITDGFCVFGPCSGANLESIPVTIRQKRIELTLPPLEESF